MATRVELMSEVMAERERRIENSPDKARNRYIQVAALAVAAVEAIDRKKSNAT